jgi:bacterioferritin (cytochrome b1)
MYKFRAKLNSNFTMKEKQPNLQRIIMKYFFHAKIMSNLKKKNCSENEMFCSKNEMSNINFYAKST